MKKYYEAYDKRYRQIHEKGLSWSVERNTPIVEDTIRKCRLEDARMLEIGCGEGRDARYLLNRSFNVMAIDVSPEAIDYCIGKDPEHRENYAVADILGENDVHGNYGFIYSVACLHMLVLDEDRKGFYRFICEHLENDGYALILSMGDGRVEYRSDISEAFHDVKRIHQETEEEFCIAATSCRIVNADTFQKEAKDNGFRILDYGMTQIENHFDQMMYMIIKKH
ncbi:MAG: class I SAM-dependent methyltransferase [Erysipelotrichaceae bacterium]|nr:class I SAM-dependent methyltransferase [Erysipelotrichaceae bacterium]